MKKKKVKLKFVTYSDNKAYDIDDQYFYLDKQDVSEWNVDERYKIYSEELYPIAKIGKDEYQRIVREIVDFQKIGRKLSSREADYLFELWRAIEPKHALHWVTKEYYLKKGKKAIHERWRD